MSREEESEDRTTTLEEKIRRDFSREWGILGPVSPADIMTGGTGHNMLIELFHFN